MTTEVKQLLLSIDQPMNVNFTSFEEECKFYDMGSIQAYWTGANATTALIYPEVSNDKVNWCALLPSTQSKKVDVAAGCTLYAFPNLEYNYIRMKFVKNTNSAGTMSILCVLKRRRGPGG